MNKYIELGKAIGAVNGAFEFEVETPDNYRDIAVETLKLLPSVELVRCKDCIYHTEDNECANGRWDNWSNSEYGLYPEALEMDYGVETENC